MPIFQKIVAVERVKSNYNGCKATDIPSSITALPDYIIGRRGSRTFNAMVRGNSGIYSELFQLHIPVLVDLTQDAYDIQKVRTDFNIEPDRLYLRVTERETGTEFVFSELSKDDTIKSILIDTDKIDSYVCHETREYALFSEQELFRWIDNAKIEKWFVRKFRKGTALKNKYYKLTEKDIKTIKKIDPNFDGEWQNNLFAVISY